MSDGLKKLGQALLNPIGFIHGLIPGRVGQALTNPLGTFHSFIPGTQEPIGPAQLNKPRWAYINDKAGENPVRYGWSEQTLQKTDPADFSFGWTKTIDFVIADGGMRGTTDLNPVIEPNGKNLAVGDYVLVQAEYYDPDYDVVFSVVNNGAVTGSGMEFAKCLVTDPDAAGRYNSRLQTRQPDGQLADYGAMIWLREAQNMGRMVENGIYQCSLTGFAGARLVYTVADFILIVANATLSQIVTYAHLMLFSPNRCWTILTAATRVPSINRIVTVMETGGTEYEDIFKFRFDPATNWEVDDADNDGIVIIRRVLDIYEGSTERTTLTYRITFDDTDFDVAATAVGHATVNTSGFTGTRDIYRYCCVTGTLYEVSATVSVTRGLVKAWAAMPTCP